MWIMARNTQKPEYEKCTLQDPEYGEKLQDVKYGEKHSKRLKMINIHCKTWIMVRKLKNKWKNDTNIV